MFDVDFNPIMTKSLVTTLNATNIVHVLTE